MEILEEFKKLIDESEEKTVNALNGLRSDNSNLHAKIDALKKEISGLEERIEALEQSEE